MLYFQVNERGRRRNDLHFLFSTSLVPVLLADWPELPFLTPFQFASFELWPQKWGRFFWGRFNGIAQVGSMKLVR
jgi:hypothetical protein